MTAWPHLSMATGPGDVAVRTLRDHIWPVVHYSAPAFMELFERTAVLLWQVYRTRHDVVIMQGETVARHRQGRSTRSPRFAQIAAESGVLTVVDASLSLGGEPLDPDAWGIDVAVAGPQECLSGVPGLAMLAVSPRAWEALERRRPPLRGTYLSLLDWRESWIARRRFPYTPSVSLVYALESVLAQVLEVGVDQSVARHALIGRTFRAGVRALGLELWPACEAIATNAVTAVRIPQGVAGSDIVAHMRERYGVKIAGAYQDMADRVIHLGHMGPSAHPARLAALLAVLERTLADLGVPVRLGAGVGAAMAVLADWS